MAAPSQSHGSRSTYRLTVQDHSDRERTYEEHHRFLVQQRDTGDEPDEQPPLRLAGAQDADHQERDARRRREVVDRRPGDVASDQERPHGFRERGEDLGHAAAAELPDEQRREDHACGLGQRGEEPHPDQGAPEQHPRESDERHGETAADPRSPTRGASTPPGNRARRGGIRSGLR
jgi:hypothetical protein